MFQVISVVYKYVHKVSLTPMVSLNHQMFYKIPNQFHPVLVLYHFLNDLIDSSISFIVISAFSDSLSSKSNSFKLQFFRNVSIPI